MGNARRYGECPPMDSSFIRSVAVVPTDSPEQRAGCPWEPASVRALADGLALHPRVTYFAFSTRASHSPLGDAIRL
jgi:hypothetical protein